jgi:hypothetical protein
MKKIFLSFIFTLSIVSTLSAQDEGAAVAQERFVRDKSIYFGVGHALTLGKNLGDYSNGLSFEAGFLKKLNKVMSIGPSLIYSVYKYDKDKTYPYYYDPNNDEFYELYLEGGDVSMLSIGFTLKLNFIPVGDNSKFTIYGIGTPFVCSATRKELSAVGVYYYFDGVEYQPIAFETTADDFEQFKKESSITGGLNAGFGFEVMPSKTVSFFGQVTVSYTMPINYVSSQEYNKDATEYSYPENPDEIYYDAGDTIYDEDYPIVKKGFPGLNLRFGISYNFK